MYSVTVFWGSRIWNLTGQICRLNGKEGLTSKDVEESFEDPFSCKFLPDSPRFSEQSRYFNLGMSTSGYGIFSVYRTNGKQIRVVMARGFTEDETFFYQRKMNQLIS